MRASFGTLGVALLLCLAPGHLLFAQAPQTADGLPAEPFATATGPPEVRPPTTEAQAVQASGAPSAQAAVSVVTLLGLDERQVDRLDRLYDDYARNRLTQQEIIGQKGQDLVAAQSPASFDERRAGRLVKDIGGAEQKVAEAFLKSQAAALRLLTAGQRSRIEGLRAAPQGVRGDKYRELLLLRVQDLWQAPVETETTRRLLESGALQSGHPAGYGPPGYFLRSGYDPLYFPSRSSLWYGSPLGYGGQYGYPSGYVGHHEDGHAGHDHHDAHGFGYVGHHEDGHSGHDHHDFHPSGGPVLGLGRGSDGHIGHAH